jgi:hypothetical protein
MAGNRMAAADQSNDRVARRSSMTILLKDDPGPEDDPATGGDGGFSSVSSSFTNEPWKGCRMTRLPARRKAEKSGM